MAVRRLHPDQPEHFAFTVENMAWAKGVIATYPEGKQASAIIPLLWRAQEQSGGWLPEPAIRSVCDMLGMAHIRGLEIATFYTMFQLSPVGSKAHIQVCGTTPCMLNGSRALVEVCKRRIAEEQHQLSPDGTFSWEEVECIGNCANAPVVQIYKDTYEDLTPATLDVVIDGYEKGKPPKPGSQIGRRASCPAGGPTTLTDPSLYDGSVIGAWRHRFAASEQAEAVEIVQPSALASPAHKAAVAEGTSPSSPDGGKLHPAALTAMANAGLVKELNARGTGAPLSTDALEKMKAEYAKRSPASGGAASMPELLKEPRAGKGDDLGLIWGVGDALAKKLNDMGIWHFDQIARWTPSDVAWFETQMDGFKGRIARDKWIEQCQKLATGWRPDSAIGERPKG